MTHNNKQQGWRFIGNDGTFRLGQADRSSYLYFPLVNEAGMMSSVTPGLHGQAATGHNSFVTAPLSVEDLHASRASRQFWFYVHGRGPWSVSGQSAAQIAASYTGDAEETTVEAGLLWHRIKRSGSLGLSAETTSFVPCTDDQVELMKVKVFNTGTEELRLTPTAAIPLYARSADDLRDHRHVTSLLHRTYTHDGGVEVQPALSFDERGHRVNRTSYGVLGADGDGRAPVGLFPVLETFIGEGGSLDWPEAVILNREPETKAGARIDGYEAMGGLRFADAVLAPGDSAVYIVIVATGPDRLPAEELLARYGTDEAFERLLEENRRFWAGKVDAVSFASGDSSFDLWMKWVTLQPVLRRLYGNSFLPYHDYGRGGRGWRDLWQDCLALLFMEPEGVRELLLNNFGGVRIDGTNATIIGQQPGEFIADRNNIPRVWMDHGAWPFLTVKLYLDQSGDLDFLLQEQTYFRDVFMNRCKQRDTGWDPAEGSLLKTAGGEVYRGTVLEHLLLQNLVPFFHVGEHNNILLEGADWNDGLDMGTVRGESVAFTSFYAANLLELAGLLDALRERRGQETVVLAEELVLLLDSLDSGAIVDYHSAEAKRGRLQAYYEAAPNVVTGHKTALDIATVAEDLRRKGRYMIEHLRANEWIGDEADGSWFNGYYDNDGNRVEGTSAQGVRMTLTGQVFPLMSGAASHEQAVQAVEAVNRHLLDPKIGYRLNSDFGGIQQNLGRAFGFAFGHKENGAMFSHMTIMYGNALYKRGFVREGYKVLNSLYRLSTDFATSRMYPGIPEYINESGRGMYTYLTGSASWLLLTMITEVYGVKGRLGDLELNPQLVREQLDEEGRASIQTLFAGNRVEVSYRLSPEHTDEDYRVLAVTLNGEPVEAVFTPEGGALISRALLKQQPDGDLHRIGVVLGG